MIKRYLALVLCLLLVFPLWGCSKETAESSAAPEKADTTAPSETEGQSARTVPEEKYLCPWEYDVCDRAVTQGTLDYYFMSSNGFVLKDGEPGKWGDCCLIVFPNGQTMLVDSGQSGMGPLLVEDLLRMGVKKLDFVVITHPHLDHLGGVFRDINLNDNGIVGHFEIGQVYYSGSLDPSLDTNNMVKDACEAWGLSFALLEQGDTLQIGEVFIEVLWPVKGTSETFLAETDINNNSLVMRLDYKDHSSLFTGDLHEPGEMFFLMANEAEKVDADLLKIPHHGRPTSGSVDFLNTVSPTVSVATGYVEMPETLQQRYRDCGSEVYTDYIHGYVLVSTDGTDMTVETSRQAPMVFETPEPDPTTD